MGGDTVDPRAVPGSYEKTEEGFVRTDEPIQAAPHTLGSTELDVDELKAIAEASEAAGFPPPVQVAAAIEAADAKAAADAAEAAAEARRLARARPADPKPSAATPAEAPKE